MISGIQHFAFCVRQWFLIHIEQTWNENELTVGGHLLHKNVDNKKRQPLEKGIRYVHSMHLASYTIGIYGIADIVAFGNHKGASPLYPIEYKHGKPKKNIIDEVQLCAQALCLEEMFGCELSFGYIYYGKIRQRVEIRFSDRLREETLQIVAEMHDFFKSKKTAPGFWSRKCTHCSMLDECMPLPEGTPSASDYLKNCGMIL